MDPEAVIKRAHSDEMDKALNDATDVAEKLGVFGSPSFVVRKPGAPPEVFWGDDRLEDAILWAAGTHPWPAK